MNRIEVNFSACLPAPARGYEVLWRVAGSGVAYTEAGNFFNSPAVFYDPGNPAGTEYEGLIRSDCGDVFGNPVNWSTVESSGTPPGYSIALMGECLGIDSSYLISGGTAGDIVKVRASFSGMLQRNSNIFTKACLDIGSADGVSDPEICSACYEDSLMHSFLIEREVTITMAGSFATVNISAVIHNGSTSPTALTLTIFEVNGDTENISVAGCRGNSGTGGNCS